MDVIFYEFESCVTLVADMMCFQRLKENSIYVQKISQIYNDRGHTFFFSSRAVPDVQSRIDASVGFIKLQKVKVTKVGVRFRHSFFRINR